MFTKKLLKMRRERLQLDSFFSIITVVLFISAYIRIHFDLMIENSYDFETCLISFTLTLLFQIYILLTICS